MQALEFLDSKPEAGAIARFIRTVRRVSRLLTADPIDADTRILGGRSDRFREDVMHGLDSLRKSLPSRWLYDEQGSELFEEITRLPEYYPTRTETRILRSHAQDIADFCGPDRTVLEYGAGAGVKTEILMRTLKTPRLYVPVDIAGEFLDRTATRFRCLFPELTTQPVEADFNADFALPEWMPLPNRVAFFPGSTIGNLDTGEVATFLQRMRVQVGPSGRAIVGVDLRKAMNILLPAYDDAAGVTARFNLNLLTRINRELGANFALEKFSHAVRWNESEAAVEMHLVSQCDQVVMMGGRTFDFAAGESIHTESSRKYDIEGFRGLTNRNRWHVERVWTDEDGRFAIFGLT
jgi:L-histidine N-alpha-methyltransferase